MVLVDTSIWIRFLANRAPYAVELDNLLGRDEVVGHELVYGELLIGDRSRHTRLLTFYTQMQQINRVPHDSVVAFVRDRKLNGRGIGWIERSFARIRTCGETSVVDGRSETLDRGERTRDRL